MPLPACPPACSDASPALAHVFDRVLLPLHTLLLLQVDYAVEDALVEAGHAAAEEVDFEGFLRMLHRTGTHDSLDALEQVCVGGSGWGGGSGGGRGRGV